MHGQHQSPQQQAQTARQHSADSREGAAKPAPLVAPNHALILYTRPIHPEHVQLKARRSMQLKGLGSGPTRLSNAADVEAWLTPQGHMVRYQTRTHCFCELLTERQNGLPTSGVAFSVQAQGEKDHEQLFAEACVHYTASVQTESLPAPIYASNYREMVELAEEVDALVHTWTQPGPNGTVARFLSMLELQRYDDEMHCQSSHMSPLASGGGIVLRTQTVFQRV